MSRLRPLTLIAGFVLLINGGVLTAAQAPSSYDLIIRNARIVDGTGNPWYRGEVAVKGDIIAAVAPKIPGQAKRVIDTGGQVVSPGFIDPHTHASRGIFAVPTAENYVRQGVTTIMEGPDGGSPIPLKPFLAKVAATRIGDRVFGIKCREMMRPFVLPTQRAAVVKSCSRRDITWPRTMRPTTIQAVTPIISAMETTEGVIKAASTRRRKTVGKASNVSVNRINTPSSVPR